MSLSLCRICLKLDTTITKNIFLVQPYTQQICDMIRDLTQLQVAQNDPLSKLICNDCHKKLIRAYKFRALIINSDWKFRQKYCLLTNINPQTTNTNNNNNTMQITVKTEAIQKEFRCAICDRCYELEDELLDHELEMHSDLKATQITTDHSLIKTEKIDRIEIKTENDDDHDYEAIKDGRIYKCCVCSNGFPSKQHLNNHGLDKHPDVTCEIRQEILAKPHSLQRHKSVDDLSNTVAFKNRLLMHDNDRRAYGCEMCSKTFRQAHSVIKHSRMHAGEKSFRFKVMTRYHSDEIIKKKKRKH